MSVTAPIRRTMEDIAGEAGDIIMIVIGIIIFYALITIGGKLWSGLQGLFSGIQGLNLGGASEVSGGSLTGPQGPGAGAVIGTPPGLSGTYVQTTQQTPSGNQILQTNAIPYTLKGPVPQVATYPQISQYFLPLGPGIQQVPGVQVTPGAYGKGPNYAGTMYIVPQWVPGGGGSSSWGVPLTTMGGAGIISNPTKITIAGGAGGK